MNLPKLFERVVWTFVQAFLGTLAGDGLLDLSIGPLKSAALGGLSAAFAVVTVAARQRLTELDQTP